MDSNIYSKVQDENCKDYYILIAIHFLNKSLIYANQLNTKTNLNIALLLLLSRWGAITLNYVPFGEGVPPKHTKACNGEGGQK